MTNFEKFKSKILEAINNSHMIALKNNEPVPCNTIMCCKECNFNCPTCQQDLYRWLYEEYEEPKINLPEEIKVDTSILVSNDGKTWLKRHFAKIEFGYVVAWKNGLTSWSANNQSGTTHWKYAKLPDEVE